MTTPPAGVAAARAEASDSERRRGWVPWGCATAALGVGLVAAEGWLLVTLSLTSFDRVAGLVPAASLSVGVVGTAWLWRHERWTVGETRRQFGWALLGGVSVGAAGALTVLHAAFNGTPLAHPVYLLAVWTMGGAVIGLLVSVYDVRRNRATAATTDARRDAERARQRLSVLNRVLRHDVRNHVNVIEGHTQRLVEEADGDRADSARAVERATADLVAVCDTARSFERLLGTADALPPRDAAALAREVAARREGLAPGADIRVDIEGSAPVPRVLELGLEQVVENAVVHHPGEATVTVTVAVADGSVTVTVADDGPGIPPGKPRCSTRRRRRNCSTAAGSGCGWRGGARSWPGATSRS
ncbi:sensor histidine kinase [Halosegnis marinus]|uniref:histidine kinase n=1 Tax=Halosegnis marinus TaxID=3034023 RepID=A0ABD5ZK86_9EURY|nr:ATP-binding protein [Halosegnis sp. DT85]